MVLDVLAARVGGKFKLARKGRAHVVEGRLGPLPGRRVVLAKPLSFMNVSGGPVAALRQFYRVEPAAIVVVHDELDLPFGVVRLKQGGGEGGHNGLRSISQSIGTKDYVRVRVGIGRPPGRQDPADFVLRDFSSTERKELDFLTDRAADAAEAIVTDGLLAAQNSFHASP
jgi:PTH1 family peptidyl-tRNA hydrolase